MEINLPVNLCATGNGLVVAELSWTIVTFVLYMRGVIPLPYDQFAASAQSVDEGMRPSSKDRKVAKLLGDLRELRDAVWACAAVAAFHKLSILLGPSANNPLERYTVQFVGTEPDVHHVGVEVSEKQVNQAKRRVLQKLIEVQAQSSVCALPRVNVFLAISISREAGDNLEGIQGADETKGMSGKALDVFAFRDSFRWDTGSLRPLNNKRPEVRLRLVGAPGPGPVPVGTDPSLSAEVEGSAAAEGDGRPDPVPAEASPVSNVWLVSRKGIKGLPSG